MACACPRVFVYPCAMKAPLRFRHFLVPLAVTAVVAGLTLQSGAAGLQNIVYDMLLRLRVAAPARPEVLLVDVDDEAVRLAGSWPWPRSLLADGLVALREMNAREAVIELPLARRSAPGVDAAALRQELPDALTREFSQIEENVQSLFDAIRRGSVRPQEASRYVTDLVGLVAMAKDRLSNAATGIERDDDALLGQAAGFFGSTFVPVELSSTAVPADIAGTAEVLERLSTGVSTKQDVSVRAPAVLPAVTPVAMGARGGGFSGILPGADPVRRSVSLVAEAGDRHYVQIALAALVDFLGWPTVELRPRALVLRGAALPGRARSDIAVPLGDGTSMLLDWPRASSGDGFRHLSWAQILRYGERETELVAALRDLDARGYLSYLRSDTPILGAYEQAARLRRDMLAAGTAQDVDDWRAAREQFFALCDQFLGGDAESRVLADIDRTATSRSLSTEESRLIVAGRLEVPALFSAARRAFDSLTEVRKALKEAMDGSIAIIAAAGSVDQSAGRTPFGSAASAGTVSAALVGTVLGGHFLAPLPFFIPPLVALVLALGLGLFGLRLRPLLLLVAGLVLGILAAAVLAGLFFLRREYVDPVVPCAAVVLSGVALAIFEIAARRGKRHALRLAFAGRVSREGLKSLAATPGLLEKAGRTRELAVLSAALRGMASGTLPGKAAEAARLLRAYHTGIGEAVLTQDGVLAGAAGDSMCAFFGVTDEREDRAARACRAALRTKSIEAQLAAGQPSLLAVHVGIDAGACVVGDLGIRDGAGWSAAGSPTDLASRLQALNLRYGTSVLVSGAVRDAASAAFLLRTVETLRVAGTAASVRVYELLAERGNADQGLVEMLGLFEEGRERFERREWKQALVLFNRVLALHVSDGPAAVFADRCRQLLADPGRSISSPPC